MNITTTINIGVLRVDAVLNVVVDKGDVSLADCQHHIRVALPTKDCLVKIIHDWQSYCDVIITWSALMRFLARSTSTWT